MQDTPLLDRFSFDWHVDVLREITVRRAKWLKKNPPVPVVAKLPMLP